MSASKRSFKLVRKELKLNTLGNVDQEKESVRLIKKQFGFDSFKFGNFKDWIIN